MCQCMAALIWALMQIAANYKWLEAIKLGSLASLSGRMMGVEVRDSGATVVVGVGCDCEGREEEGRALGAASGGLAGGSLGTVVGSMEKEL
uniref:Uncharacterized protein n=1 Tax=Romanomermis culicivorax TaxID=13658 RepID=A0A915K7U6_ROMCU